MSASAFEPKGPVLAVHVSRCTGVEAETQICLSDAIEPLLTIACSNGKMVFPKPKPPRRKTKAPVCCAPCKTSPRPTRPVNDRWDDDDRSEAPSRRRNRRRQSPQVGEAQQSRCNSLDPCKDVHALRRSLHLMSGLNMGIVATALSLA